jgi:hypothetical protein
MYENVAAHVWSPPNFHHSEEEAKSSNFPNYLCFELRRFVSYVQYPLQFFALGPPMPIGPKHPGLRSFRGLLIVTPSCST